MTTTRTRRRQHLQVVPAQNVPGNGLCCPAAERAELALDCFEIGVRTYCSRLPVDWAHVAYRMAQAIAGEDEDAARERPS